MATDTLNHTTEDIAYLRHADVQLKLRFLRPQGSGPFPLVVDLHGGAWTQGDLTGCQERDEMLVKEGFATAALDFRHAGDGYPTSLVDINFALRWLKSQSERLGIDPGRVGISGQSSGGHLAVACRSGSRHWRFWWRCWCAPEPTRPTLDRHFRRFFPLSCLEWLCWGTASR